MEYEYDPLEGLIDMDESLWAMFAEEWSTERTEKALATTTMTTRGMFMSQFVPTLPLQRCCTYS